MFELQDIGFRTIAYGSRDYVNQYVKHQVVDGCYRIRGPQLEFYCVRRNGRVYPDPERAPLKLAGNFQTLALHYAA
jgi:hypothetical protein